MVEVLHVHARPQTPHDNCDRFLSYRPASKPEGCGAGTHRLCDNDRIEVVAFAERVSELASPFELGIGKPRVVLIQQFSESVFDIGTQLRDRGQ